METGRVLNRFAAKDGTEVIIRSVKWEDLDDIIDLWNSLVDEGAEIGQSKKVTLDGEADRLGKLLTLSLFATNRIAYHLYEKLGFIETGRIPKALFKDGKYIDEVMMTKELL